jgi:hypothetical protein
MSNLINNKLIRIYNKRAAAIPPAPDPLAVSMPWDNPAISGGINRELDLMLRADPNKRISHETVYANLESMAKAQGKDIASIVNDPQRVDYLKRMANMREAPIAAQQTAKGVQDRANRRVQTETVNWNGSGKVTVTPTYEDTERKRLADEKDKAFDNSPAVVKAKAEHQKKLERAALIGSITTPTENSLMNYGIHGGIGALIGGGLGALFSGSKNRWRNALLMALLGGGIGVGGSYLANRPEAPMELPKAKA